MARFYKRKYKTRRKTYKKNTTKKGCKNICNRVKKIERSLKRNDFHKFRVEYQGPKHLLNARWNNTILMAPSQITLNTESAAWKYIFGNKVMDTALNQKPDLYVKSMVLMQHFNLRALAAKEYQSMPDAPVTIHNYVVSLKQDFGSAWKKSSNGEYTISYLTENVHFAKLGGNTSSSIVTNGTMFFLNKDLFTVHAEHHHTFAPYWLKQALSQGSSGDIFENARANMPATRRSDYCVTYKDYIKLNRKFSSRGNTVIAGANPTAGWTGITYQDIPATDQLFTITWCSQAGDGVVGSYAIEMSSSGIIYCSC